MPRFSFVENRNGVDDAIGLPEVDDQHRSYDSLDARASMGFAFVNFLRQELPC